MVPQETHSAWQLLKDKKLIALLIAFLVFLVFAAAKFLKRKK